MAVVDYTVEPKMLICPECKKRGEYSLLRVYHTITIGVEVEWKDGKVVMRVPGGDSLPLSNLFGEIEGEEIERDKLDGEDAECLECDYSVHLDDFLFDVAMYATEEESL